MRIQHVILHICNFIYVLLVGCAMLTAPTNGMVNCSLGADGVATDGDTCSYTCNTGYMLIGNAIRTCESDGMWSGTEPTCVGKFLSDFKIYFKFAPEIQ